MSHRGLLGVLVAACLAVAACGTSGGSSAPESSPGVPSGSPASASPLGTASGSGQAVELKVFLAEGPGRQQGFAKVVDLFEAAHPNIKVTIRTAPFADYFTQIPIEFASAAPPDVVLADSPDVQSYAYQGAIVPLDDVFSQEDLNDFAPSILNELTFNGHLYGAPWEESSIAVYYNTTMFSDAGVTVPSGLDGAWTWPDFVSNVRKVIDKQTANGNPGVLGSIFLNNPPTSDYWQLPLVRSNGAKGSPTFAALSPDGTTVSGDLDTPEAKEGLRYWQQLYTSGFLPSSDVPDAFGTDKAATMISFPAWGSILDQSFPKLKWGVLPLPYLKTPITHTGGWTPVISAKGKHQAEAKEFARFSSSKEGFNAYYAISSVMPSRRSLLNSLDAFQSGPLAVFKDELLNWGQPRPAGPGHSIYSTQIDKLFSDTAKGADVDQTVAAWVTETDQLLAQFKK